MARLIENQQHLAAWVKAHRGSIDIAVAFWGVGAVDELGLSDKTGKFRILLDIASGASNPSEVQRLLDLDPNNVRCLDRLHAKAYITESELLVGSANASANGLGSEGTDATRWHELGLTTRAPKLVAAAQAWFDRKWQESRRITPVILREAAEKWQNRQRLRPSAKSALGNLLVAVGANPTEFINRGIYVVVSTGELSDKANRLIARREEETGRSAFAFEDWPGMPVNAKLVCFSDYEGNGFCKDEPELCYTGPDRQKGPVRWVYPAEIGGFKVGGIAAWRKPLAMARDKDQKGWKKNGGMCMDLGEFALAFLS